MIPRSAIYCFATHAWRCQIGECNFLMHATITRWDPEAWKQQAQYSYQQGITDMRAIEKHFSRWMVTASPSLLSIDQVVATDVVGTIKKDGSWRAVINFADKDLKKKLYDIKGNFENEFAITHYACSRKLNFSVDLR